MRSYDARVVNIHTATLRPARQSPTSSGAMFESLVLTVLERVLGECALITVASLTLSAGGRAP